jgi:hypothetical protein
MNSIKLAVALLMTMMVAVALTPTTDAATITVTSTGDSVAVDGAVTLREAILSVNGGANVNADVVAVGAYGPVDTINFNVGGADGVKTIAPTSALPPLAKPMLLDATTQPCGLCGSSRRVVLDGVGAGAGVDGLSVQSSSVRINGFSIGRFTRHGIAVENTSVNALITSCYIGLDAAGAAATPNGGSGIAIRGAASTTIGGAASGEGNVVAGNTGANIANNAGSTNTKIVGNRVGVNATATAAVANGLFGVYSEANGLIVGGPTAGERNIISGHATRPAINLIGSTATIQGNFIGTDLTGTLPIPNQIGILVDFGPNTLIGGTAPGTANLIAFNTLSGISLPPANQTGISILANGIHSNGALGIDLNGGSVSANDALDADGNSNGGQNFPVLTAATSNGGGTTVTGSLPSTPNTNGFRVEFFSSPACDPSGNGEGQFFLGSTTVNTNAAGDGPFNVGGLPPVTVGHLITATAAAPDGSTSEFSACIAVVQAPPQDIPPPPASGEFEDDTKKDKERRVTSQQKLQKDRTNTGSEEDERTEGDIIAIDETAKPPTVTIATRDGLQTVVMLCRDSCDKPVLGRYLKAWGWKEHEGLFYADSADVKRR